MNNFLQYPLVGHQPPIVTQRLLEDCALDVILTPYIKNPIEYLTWDIHAISERNSIFRELLDNPKVYVALKALVANLDELWDIIQQRDSDPMLVLNEISILPETHKLLLAACDILRAKSYPVDSPFKAVEHTLSLAVEKCFPRGLQDAWAIHSSERTVAVSYIMRFDDEMKLQDSSLASTHSLPFRKPLLRRNRKRQWLGGIHSLLSDDRSTPGYNYDPSRVLNPLQRCKIAFNKLLAVQALEGKCQITDIARKLLDMLRSIYIQLKFFLSATSLVLSWGKDAYCFPEICVENDAVFQATDIIHPSGVGWHVGNSFLLNEDSSIALLGGFNRGGKTTFLRTVLAAQVLFQMGLPVLATSARLSPASSIVSVSARREGSELGQSKFALELVELRTAVISLDSHGFFAFNEPITATSVTECLHLSKEILCIVKSLKGRGVWVTHLYGMYDMLEDINDNLPGGYIFPMRTALKTDELPEFSIVAGKPEGGSAARQLIESMKHSG